MSHGDGPPETGITQQPGLTESAPLPPEEEEGGRRKRRRRKRDEGGARCGVSGCCEDDCLTTFICWDAGCEGTCCCLQLLSCW
jgi:hypothetical protein